MGCVVWVASEIEQVYKCVLTSCFFGNAVKNFILLSGKQQRDFLLSLEMITENSKMPKGSCIDKEEGRA
ncbi:hypothetical protein FHS56_000821 [Thermonema lapsum]|uniref:Uncharacterized protein n=1 Tax=Thermonema lapsum TaxID=28195 RepID=A0A846MPE9_9BACT|nr:hypothetical protein [Thermonema lapsum]